MAQYRVICKSCNTVHGIHPTNNIEGLSSKCDKCGMQRIAVELIIEEKEVTGLEFDLFVSNKRTGLSCSEGCLFSADEMISLGAVELRNLLVDRLAQSLGKVLNDYNIRKLLGMDK